MVSKAAGSQGHVLVTGATGGLGFALCTHLRRQGRAVRAVGRNQTVARRLEAMGCEFVRADFLEPINQSLTRGASSIFHLAAISKPWGRKEDFEAVNLRATEQLVQSAQANGCHSLIFASTPSIFSEARDRIGIAEDDPIAQPFANDYARTKYLAEQCVLDSGSADLAVVALRPRAITGPNDTVLLPRLMRAAERGFMPLPRRGKALIEVTDVRDVVRAFMAAEAHIGAASGKAFNISGGEPVALKQLLTTVFSALNLKVRSIRLPTWALHTLGAGLEGIAVQLPGRPEPLLTRYMANTLSYSQTFEISRAQNILNWQPQHSLEAAIKYALEGAAR